jgi:hypothetical protein
MQSFHQVYDKVIEQKLYAQNPVPTQSALDCFKRLLFQEKLTSNESLKNLIALGLELDLIPYLKRHGLNVENTSFNTGDLIGIYFAKTVRLDINDSLYIRGKFCGLDLAESTVNLQYFAPNKKVNDQVLKLAKSYGIEDQIVRGSLRVSLEDDQLSNVIEDFIGMVERNPSF